MKCESYHLELITPCFCAGANPKVAELRAPSIRGQLRWWFRALGGTLEQEKRIFGGVHGTDAQASAFTLRISNVQRGAEWPDGDRRWSMRPGRPGSYIWYFASVSSEGSRWWDQKPTKIHEGRPNNSGNIPPETRFKLHLLWNLPDRRSELFDLALRGFLAFGGIGLRLSRGMGAVTSSGATMKKSHFESVAEELSRHQFQFKFRDRNWKHWEEAVFDAESWIKNGYRAKNNFPAARQSALGQSAPRQTSALYFRPICVDGHFTFVVFEAPLNRVCDPSRRYTSVIDCQTLKGNAPAGEPRAR